MVVTWIFRPVCDASKPEMVTAGKSAYTQLWSLLWLRLRERGRHQPPSASLATAAQAMVALGPKLALGDEKLLLLLLLLAALLLFLSSFPSKCSRLGRSHCYS